MTTAFSSLPIIDVGALKQAQISDSDSGTLGTQLHDVFATTGFAYLVNAPLSFDHAEIFELAIQFFALDWETKMKLAKKSFRSEHANTYRGYFPTQPHLALDNLKEGFEIGSPTTRPAKLAYPYLGEVTLSEPNVWPPKHVYAGQERLEQIYGELQLFASKLLSLLAVTLSKAPDFFDSWLVNSLSTLRLLHYPSVPQDPKSIFDEDPVKLSCTPHTDSGILTLLHQDSTGGLEVLNASGDWIAAPYVPGSIVVNIGDLMAQVSGGRFTATSHRVRSPRPRPNPSGVACGRFSIPFFFEPGEACIVSPVDGEHEAVVYGEHVRKKMRTWVEFQEDSGYDTTSTT